MASNLLAMATRILKMPRTFSTKYKSLGTKYSEYYLHLSWQSFHAAPNPLHIGRSHCSVEFTRVRLAGSPIQANSDSTQSGQLPAAGNTSLV